MPSTVSNNTLASDRQETEPIVSIPLLVGLTRAERVRRTTEPAIRDLREEIRLSQVKIDKVMADLRHLCKARRRHQRSNGPYANPVVALRAKKERLLSVSIRDRQALPIKQDA